MRNRNDTLQVLRALAFLGIFTCHSGITAFSAGGAWGVSVFLILSGFLMFCSYSETNRVKEYGIAYSIRFGIGKIKKLYPLHIVTLLLALPFLIYEYRGYIGIGRILNPAFKIAANITLMQSWVPTSGVYFSLNAVSWYLSTALFLYIMFPVILHIIGKYTNRRTGIIMILCTFAVQTAMDYVSYCVQMDLLHNDKFIHWFTYIFPLSRLEDFFIGCNLGYVYKNAKEYKKPSVRVSTLLEIGVIGVIMAQWLIYVLMVTIPAKADPTINSDKWWSLTVFWTLSSCALIYLFAKHEGKLSQFLTSRPLVFLGNLSANAFLIHQMVYRYVGVIERRVFGSSVSGYIELFVCFLITMVSSYLWDKIYLLVKRKTGPKNLAFKK